ncbi:hypothetical protein Pla110_34500 [Polystyrenella longa]|uniref:Uncharacterized protein n=1 Tax=Polystyrenella longa TaxID=2528007 RepID=A0A518CR63_9PLAN|nr:hypothetical protein Pla110_34500 [Polystyrenella longa]
MLLGLFTSLLSGCSLFVMGGKMLFGDPELTCSFTSQSAVNLKKTDEKVIVICSTPDSISSDYPSLNIDMLDGISRRLKRENITIVNPNDVARWFDDNLGVIDDPTMLALEFDAKYVITVDIDEFSYLEENSANLLRGRSTGMIRAYEMREFSGSSRAVEVYHRELVSKYPDIYPVQSDRISEKTFRKQYLDRVSEQIAQQFYNHKASEVIY